VNNKRDGIKIMPGHSAAQGEKCRWHDFSHDFWHELVNRTPGMQQ
jgi:hypothetical protein